jgi:hypothetical protein
MTLFFFIVIFSLLSWVGYSTIQERYGGFQGFFRSVRFMQSMAHLVFSISFGVGAIVISNICTWLFQSPSLINGLCGFVLVMIAALLFNISLVNLYDAGSFLFSNKSFNVDYFCPVCNEPIPDADLPDAGGKFVCRMCKTQSSREASLLPDLYQLIRILGNKKKDEKFNLKARQTEATPTQQSTNNLSGPSYRKRCRKCQRNDFYVATSIQQNRWQAGLCPYCEGKLVNE